jgi:hypothetical protein
MNGSAIASGIGALLLMAAASSAQAATTCRPDQQTFAQVYEGMPYQMVMSTLGCIGELKSTSLAQGVKTEIYEWNGSGLAAAKISAVFVNNVMVMKSAYGLK